MVGVIPYFSSWAELITNYVLVIFVAGYLGKKPSDCVYCIIQSENKKVSYLIICYLELT